MGVLQKYGKANEQTAATWGKILDFSHTTECQKSRREREMILLRELKHSKVYLYLGNLESLAHTHGKMHIQNKLENIPIFTPLANL